MNNINKRIAIVTFLLFIITPSVASAAWWNPFTWFKPSTPVSQVITQPNKGPDRQTATTTSKEDPRPTQKIKATVTPASLSILSNKQIIALVKPAIVYIEVADGEGSGMIIQSTDTYSYILTNAHVVKGVSSATVTPQGKKAFSATVVGRDEKSDIAVLKISTGGLPSVILGDSDALAQGDKVFALGYPFGISGDAAFTDGVVSKTNAKASSGKVYIQNTVEIHPGNSGGALINQYGRVVGITSANYGDQIQGVTLGETVKLAIPINTAKALIPQLENGLTITTGPAYTPVAQRTPAPTEAECQKEGQDTYDKYIASATGTTVDDPTVQSLLNEIQSEENSIKSQHDSMVAQIRAQFDPLIAQTQDRYDRLIATRRQSSIRDGTYRYATDIAQGGVSAIQQQAQDAIDQIRSQEQSLIAQADATYQSSYSRWEAQRQKVLAGVTSKKASTESTARAAQKGAYMGCMDR